jgi:hypothetical protein
MEGSPEGGPGSAGPGRRRRFSGKKQSFHPVMVGKGKFVQAEGDIPEKGPEGLGQIKKTFLSRRRGQRPLPVCFVQQKTDKAGTFV